MIPPDQELLRHAQELLDGGFNEQLEDALVLRLGQQEQGPLANNQLEVTHKLGLKLACKLQPRTTILIVMHRTDRQVRDKQYQGALLLYNELLKRRMCSDSHLALYNIAVCEENCGRAEAALAHYNRALKHKPGFWPAVLNYSGLLGRLHRFEECRRLLDNYLKHYPSRMALELQWVAASDRTHYREVMRRYRGKRLHYQLTFNIALFLKRIGNGIEAVRLLRSVERISKENDVAAVSCLLRGKIYEEHHKYEEAISAYRIVIDQYDRHREILSERISVLEGKLTEPSDVPVFTGRIPLSPLVNSDQGNIKQSGDILTKRANIFGDSAEQLRQQKLRYLLDKEKELKRFFDGSPSKRVLKTDPIRQVFDESFQLTKQRIEKQEFQQTLKESATNHLRVQRKASEEVPKRIKKQPARIIHKRVQKQQGEIVPRLKIIAPSKSNLSHSRNRFDNTLGFTLTGFPKKAPVPVCELEASGKVMTTESNTKYSQHASVSVLDVDYVTEPQPPNKPVVEETHAKESAEPTVTVSPAVTGSEIVPVGQSLLRVPTVRSGKHCLQTRISIDQQYFEAATLAQVSPGSSKRDGNGKFAFEDPATKSIEASHQNKSSQPIQKQQQVNAPQPQKMMRSQKKQTTVKFNNNADENSPKKQVQEKPQQLAPLNTLSAKPLTSLKHLEECRSIREIMDNPLYVKRREQSILTQQHLVNEMPDVSAEVDQLLTREQHDRALEIYKRQYKEAGTSELKSEILLKIAWVFERSSCLDNARKTYEKCLKLGMNTRAFVKLGELQIRMGLIEEGIDNLQKALCIMRFDEEIKLKLAYGYSMLEVGLAKALAITNEILLADPTNLRAIMLSSNIHQKMGNIDIALEISRAIDGERNNESIKHYIGLLYLQKQEVATAYASFREALRINPKYVPALIESASILSTDSSEAAVRIFEKALQIEPENLLALTRLARLYETELGDNQRAIDTYSRALAISETYETYEHLGSCYYRCGRYKEAIEHYKLAITLNCSALAWKRIAECYEHLKQHDRALNYFELALQLEPSEELHRRIGTCHIYLENFKAAIRSLKQAVELKDSAECQSLIANCYYLLEEYDLAIEHYQRSAELEDGNVNTLYNMAICFDQKEQFLVSKGLYEMVLQLDPTHTSSLYNLANIMLVLGKNSESVALFERALVQQPDNYSRRVELIQIYETTNDLNHAQQHLLYCHRENDQDSDVLERLIRVYRRKKDIKKVNRFQKLLLAVKSNHSGFRTKTQN